MEDSPVHHNLIIESSTELMRNLEREKNYNLSNSKDGPQMRLRRQSTDSIQTITLAIIITQWSKSDNNLPGRLLY